MCSFVRVNCKAFQRVSVEEKTSLKKRQNTTHATEYLF